MRAPEPRASYSAERKSLRYFGGDPPLFIALVMAPCINEVMSSYALKSAGGSNFLTLQSYEMSCG